MESKGILIFKQNNLQIVNSISLNSYIFTTATQNILKWKITLK